LALAPQWTNVLFDFALVEMVRLAGAAAAQRLAVSLCVLIFFWGAFAYVNRTAGRGPWNLTPILAMLAYGWVFHAGFLNFYLSLGLCLWALAALGPRPSRAALWAIPLLPLAWTAHGLPVFWAAGIAVFVWARRRWLLWVGVASLILLRIAITVRYPVRWLPTQLLGIAGTDQFWIYTSRYAFVMAAATCLVAVLLVRARKGWEPAVLSAAAVLLIPASVYLPGYQPGLTFVAERMSLTVPLALAPVLAAREPPRALRAALIALAALYFAMLYIDTRALNRIEDAVTRAVRAVPAGARVVSLLDEPSLRLNALAHVADRPCIGHCFSYANYEPSSAAFRVRIQGDTRLAVSDYNDSYALQTGSYIVRRRDLPLWAVALCGSEICARPVREGDKLTQTPLRISDPRWR
jgi:hypothetical protein